MGGEKLECAFQEMTDPRNASKMDLGREKSRKTRAFNATQVNDNSRA